MSEITFFKLELEQAIEQLKEENELLKQKDLERTKINLDAECACIYSNPNGTYLYGEPEQLDRMMVNCTGLRCIKGTEGPCAGNYGHTLKFASIASAKTCLLRNGYKFSHDSKAYHQDSVVGVLYFENWVKGV